MNRFFSFILLLLFANLLTAQVNFDFLFELDYPDSNPILNSIQLYDINDDDLLEIVLIFNYEHNLLFECYDTSGNFILEKSVSGNDFSKPVGYLIEHNNELLIISEFENCDSFQPFELMVKIQEFHNSTFVDSLIINPDDMFSSAYYNVSGDLKAFSQDNYLIILAGSPHMAPLDNLETSVFKFVYDNELYYDQSFSNCGKEIHDFVESDFIFTTGIRVGVMGSLHRYVKMISKDDYSTEELIYDSWGYVDDDDWSIHHYPEQFIILNQNDLFYSEYGLLLQEFVLDATSNYAQFQSYLPNSTELNWTYNTVHTNSDIINSSTSVNVNNENNYVMFFRSNQLSIQDRITGNIIHYQDSDIIPDHIHRDSNNELLFFVDNEDEGLISVYKLSEEIYVSSEDYEIPNNIHNLSNHPNPFNPSTTIQFSNQNDSDIELLIYNIKGQKIKTVANNQYEKGNHSIVWNGVNDKNKPVSSGIYLYKLNVNGKTEAMKKCLLLK